ncbi:hypothetical protein ABZY68_32515 [Streptomyces sp. NPDC006482]|uniref:hypothetical protein n=1 Tax=Streptomyces sp. NPDC006482 TaxID=3154306 RepID=UPI0033BC6F7A
MEPTPVPTPVPTPASALVSHALSVLGLDGPPKHLTGRKGADVWQAGDLIIKIAVPGARGDLAHETAAYDLLNRQGRHPGTRHGAGEDGRWLALPRLDGPTLREGFTPARDGHATPAQRTAMRQAALDALGASLHWAWTGVRPIDYRGDPAGPHAELYADIAAGRRRSLPTDRPWADPLLEALITSATAPIPEDRRSGAAV